MVFKIDGKDLLPFVAEGGFKVQRNDLESADSGRTMDGIMHRNRVSIKKRIDVTCKDLTTIETRFLLNLILPEWVTVTYTDPQEGEVTKTMYSNNIPASVARVSEDGFEVWTGISFPLIER